MRAEEAKAKARAYAPCPITNVCGGSDNHDFGIEEQRDIRFLGK